MMQYSDIINFWFNESGESKWWVKSDEFDALIKNKFIEVYNAAANLELYHWRSTAKGRLAEIIVLDQFPRNMFRGTAQSFATDSIALALAQEAITAGADKQLTALERSFLYLPFMHSESVKIHQVAVQLYVENNIQSNLDFEFKHQAIIERFGRYPHRNKILGRESTVDEIEFLSQPGSSF